MSLKKLFIGVDTRQIEKDLRHPEYFAQGFNSFRCSKTSEDIQQIREWAKTRLKKVGGTANSVLIFQSIDVVSRPPSP
jgi:hypothetical protein